MTEEDLHIAMFCATREIDWRNTHGAPVPERLRLYAQRLKTAFEMRYSADGTESPSDEQELVSDDQIGTTEAAKMLGRTTRFVRNHADTLGGHNVEGRWLFSRRAVNEYRTKEA